jgi:hypothetical protein
MEMHVGLGSLKNRTNSAVMTIAWIAEQLRLESAAYARGWVAPAAIEKAKNELVANTWD